MGVLINMGDHEVHLEMFINITVRCNEYKVILNGLCGLWIWVAWIDIRCPITLW